MGGLACWWEMERCVTPRLTAPLPTLVPVCHRVDNNHLLLLMIHVFRENEEQLFKVSPRSGEPSSDQQRRVGTPTLLSVHARPAGQELELTPICFDLDDPDEHRAHGGQPAAAVRAAHRLLRLPASERCLSLRSRPEWVGLNSPPPSPYPHFKHILMTSGRKFCCSFTLLGTERAGS